MTLITLLVTGALAQSTPAVEDHLQTHEAYAYSDGSSVFTFRADHRFTVTPVAMSGRKIDGVWTRVDGGLLITGQWTWVNGVSVDDDYREMLLHVVPVKGEASEVQGTTVLPTYATVEKLKTIDAAVYKRRMSLVTP